MDRRDGGNKQRFKRKRKKSILSDRYPCKKRQFRKGTDVGDELFSYLFRLMAVKISDFKSPEEKEIFICNVFEQTTGKEVVISCSQLGSRAMEMFLPHANKKILLKFTHKFSQDLRKICCDEYGSHVLEQLIAVVSTALLEVPSNEEEEQEHCEDSMAQLRTWLLQVSQFMINNMEEFVWNTLANHILRTVLRCLSGLPAKQSPRQEKLTMVGSHRSPIEEGPALVEKCARLLLHMPQITDFVHSQLTSLFLQTLILSVERVDCKLSRKIVRHLLDLVYDPKPMDVPSDGNISKYCSEMDGPSDRNEGEEVWKQSEVEVLLTSVPATHLMDVMIQVSKAKTLAQIYARCFMNRLTRLSLAPEANFCVQNLIKYCKKKSQFEAIFDELSPNFEELVQSNKQRIITTVGEACQRLGCRHAQFIKELQKALHCIEADRQDLFPVLVAYLMNFEALKRAEESRQPLKVSVSGSFLLQALLKFPETMKVIKAILAMDMGHLKALLCSPSGSYIADTFFSSPSVGEKSREKLCLKLKGTYVALASSRNGSRALDAIWMWAPLKFKKQILEELAPSESVLTAFQWGNIFVDKSGLSLFKRRPNDWEESMTREARTKKLFADIIGS